MFKTNAVVPKVSLFLKRKYEFCSDEFAEIAVENEKEFLLNRVLDEGYNTLYIIKILTN